jgi:Putative sensor
MTGGAAPGTSGTPDSAELPGSDLTSDRPPAAAGSGPSAPGENAPAIPWAQLAGRARTGLAAAGHGLLLLALAVPGLVLSLLVLALALPGPGLVAYALGQHHNGGRAALILALPAAVVSLLLASWLLLGIRGLARATRRLSGRWCGVPIPDPYLPRPAADGETASWRRRLTWLLTDPATWRDLLWALVNGCVGWLLAVLPAGLLVLGVLGVIAPYTSGSVRLLTIALAVGGSGRRRG